MKLPLYLSSLMLKWSFQFYLTHLWIIAAICLFASVGRAIQMGAIGEISSGWYTTLEVIVALSRLTLLVAVIGKGKILQGFRKIRNVFRSTKEEREDGWRTIVDRLKAYWLMILWNCLLFGLLAFLINFLIGYLASMPEVLGLLKDNNILHENATQTPMVFFLKNLTVIPFTLIFEYSIFLFLINRMCIQKK
ncbi:hypothetical protein [Catalinimonas niigatensis]|uniref:hypothetical protein n=1 Tax=Catalinimonas niigatensis TaxID=1397264 RepID=UPI0026661C1C|nr:hypothetical protein [Catalinimonas niigatensis]WPP50478.1 hypothetical protein PZB72_27820 [Catalinimonas niigatensis]